METDAPLLSELDFVALDLETTGLSCRACRIVEFGAVRFRLDGTECGRFEQLVNPECPIPYAARRVHGISDAMVRGMPTVAEVLPDFLEFLGGPETLLMAHNAPFDMGFLDAAVARQGIAGPPHAVLDTVRLARRCLPGLYSYSLAPLVVALGISQGTEHRGLSDACRVMDLFRALLGCRPQFRTLGDLVGLSPLLEFAAPPLAPSGSENHDTLITAIRESRRLTIVYDGGSKGRCQREITPRSLRSRQGRRYLLAWCHADHVEKTYRVDRIIEIHLQ